MSTPYFPQLFTQPAKTYDNPSVLGIVFKGVEQMNKMYYANKENYYRNIKTPIDKLQVDEKDQEILNESRQHITDMMAPVIENDTFHKAEGIITDIGQYINSNQLLNGAIAANQALQAKQQEIADSKYTAEYKDKYWRYLNLKKKTVSVDEKTGRVDIGVPTEYIVEAYDDKALDSLLSTVNSMSDYPITETEVESFVQSAKAKGINIDVDDDGNASSFITIKNGSKYLDKEKVIKAVTARMSNSEGYMAYIKQLAKLDIVDAQYAKTVSETGKAPTEIEELVGFNMNDVVNITKASAFDIGGVLNFYKDNKEASSIISNYFTKKDKSNEVVVNGLIANYYTSMNIDPNQAYGAIYTNAYINNKINSIANPIADQLSFRSNSSDLTLRNNPAYTPPSSRNKGDGGVGLAAAAGSMMLSPFTVTGNVGKSMQNTGKDLLLASQQANSNASIYSTNKYNMELRALGSAVDGMSMFQVNMVRAIASSTAKGLDMSESYNRLDEQEKKLYNNIISKYDSTGHFNRSAFENDLDYRNYRNISEQYAESRYNKTVAEENYKVWHAINKPAIDDAVNDYITNDRFFNYSSSYIEENIYRPLMNKYRSEESLKRLMAYADKSSISRSVNNFIRENPNHPFSIEAKNKLSKEAVNYMDMEDLSQFKDANINTAQYGNAVFGADPQLQSFINNSLTTNQPHSVIYSTVSKDDDKLDVQRILNGSRGSNNAVYENVKITPYQFSEGGMGAIVTDNVTGDYAIVKFDIPLDQSNKFVRLNIDKAYRENRNHRGLQSALIQNNVRNIVGQNPISVNGMVMTSTAATERVQQLATEGNAPVIQFRSPLQDVYGDESSNRIITAQAFKTGQNGYAMRILGVTGVEDVNELASIQQAYFPHDYSYSDEGIVYTPKGAASITDLISIIGAHEVIAYKEHQERNR